MPNNNNLTYKNKSPEGRNRTHQKNTHIFNRLSFNTKMLQTAKFPSLDYLSWTGRKMQNRGLIDGWTATGGINRSDFSSWILAGIFYFWMGFSEWLCLKAYQSFWMCGIDAISTHPGKNKEAKPVKKRLIISEPFHWCPSYRLPQSYPCQKKKQLTY